jgi:DNA processing protein
METIRAGLAVLCTPGITPSDWARVTELNPAALLSDLDASAHMTRDVLEHGVGATDWRTVDAQLEAMERLGATAVTRWDDAYPARLAQAPFAPPLLFVRGRIAALAGPALAVVGTRQPSAPGTGFARRLGRAAAASGVPVVSGMARGIDTAAHRGALDVEGVTVAVLGTGIDVVYPRENEAVMHAIIDTGCVVSEQRCGTPATRDVFPRRNRIISGLSEAVVVVEGGVKSGALITARWALGQGREVGAVPGFPGDFRSAGPNQLLREGAFLVEDAADVFLNVSTLQPRPPVAAAASTGTSAAPDDGDDARVFALVAPGAGADDIAAASGIGIARVQEILSRLEIDGHIVRDGAGRFVRKPE